MLSTPPTPLVRLGNLFPDRQVYAKCEFVAPSGSFKIRGAVHLLEHLRATGRKALVVPSMGNTALGAAVAARTFGFSVAAVVPTSLSRAKEEKLRALDVELVKIAGGGSDLLAHAVRLAAERHAHFVHPHLNPLWTDGYQGIIAEILEEVPGCRALVFPVGGGGLLMGVTAYLASHPHPVRLVGCEAFNSPTYAPFVHSRSRATADGLVLETTHAEVQERIGRMDIAIELVADQEIANGMRNLFQAQALVVEPSSAVTIAWVDARLKALEEPICVILTGENIT